MRKAKQGNIMTTRWRIGIPQVTKGGNQIANCFYADSQLMQLIADLAEFSCFNFRGEIANAGYYQQYFNI